jgi:hypothetical protein
MEEYKIRLMVEFKQLCSKVDKLREFINSDKYKTLDPTIAVLMKNQLAFMEGYRASLYDRINLTISIKEMKEFDQIGEE